MSTIHVIEQGDLVCVEYVPKHQVIQVYVNGGIINEYDAHDTPWSVVCAKYGYPADATKSVPAIERREVQA